MKEREQPARREAARETQVAPAPSYWLLVPIQGVASQLSRTLSDRVEASDIHVQLVTLAPSEAVTRARRQLGGVPLGFVGEDEVAALEALASGADEVLVWPPRDDLVIHGFFDRLKLRAKLRKSQEQRSASAAHTEKLTALSTLVAGVAHELNNPLTVLSLGIEANLSSLSPSTPPEIKQLLEELLTAAGSIANIVKDLRIFAKVDSSREEPQLLNVNEVAEQALRLVGRQLSVAACIERDYAELPPLLAPRGRLTQVLLNVLVNAAHAIGEIERPLHRVRVVTRSDGENVALSISDTGPGIAPQVIDHIFDPFFTTKRLGHGTGLGLGISRAIMQELGGDLIVESVHGSGATFILLLPIPDQVSAQSASWRIGSAPPSRVILPPRQTVLLVDDDERVLRAYARLLSRTCHVLLARDGREAIELLSSGSNPDSVLTELELPEIDGAELLEWLERERPELARRTLFVSTEAATQRYRPFLAGRSNRVLGKPVTTSMVLAALDELPAHELRVDELPGRAG